MQINPVKGTHDIIGDESEEYYYIETQARLIAASFNYKEIRTPILEQTNLFVRSVGESSDIVNKEMYTFDDKGGRSLTLRPEVTAGVMRSIATNKLYANADLPLKYCYCGPCFRYERPQAGRFRQFHQFGVEAVGAPSPELDCETISLGASIFKTLGFNNIKIKINSLGDDETRNNYRQALKEYFSKHIDNMCEDCKRRLEVNPLRILDCKVPEDIEIVKGAPKLKDFLSEPAKAYFERVKFLLDLLEIEYELDETLVRGLDYYTGVVWEYHVTGPNAVDVGAAGGGGHYKNLLKEVGGPDLEGVGLALGLERIHYLWKTLVIGDNDMPLGPDVYVMPLGEDIIEKAMIIAQGLRTNGFNTELPYDGKSLKSMFKIATRMHAKFAVIVGEEELERGELAIKNLKTGEQTDVKLENCLDVLGEMLDEYVEENYKKEESQNGEN